METKLMLSIKNSTIIKIYVYNFATLLFAAGHNSYNWLMRYAF